MKPYLLELVALEKEEDDGSDNEDHDQTAEADYEDPNPVGSTGGLCGSVRGSRFPLMVGGIFNTK
jgi:hypothetical protein